VILNEGQYFVDLGPVKLPVSLEGVKTEDHVTLSLRPEKISLSQTDEGYLKGTVTQVFFLGDRWLYHLDTALGELIVAGTNIGKNDIKEGDVFGLNWPTQAMQRLQEHQVN
jgi:putative spermidine/putrescine transport system ATP-binding protein